jgi:hypothetical protein
MSREIIKFMTDSYRIATNRYKQEVLEVLQESANSTTNTSGLYVFVGASNPFTGSDANVYAPDNTREQEANAYTQMICGKRVTSSGVLPMTRRIDWAANTLFVPYSHTDTDLFEKDFYSVVNASSFYHVFKCLENNGNSFSSSPPNFSDTSAEDTYYETSDGYVWKYMYSITKEVWDNFATRDFIPVVSSANVSGNAVSGTIDVVKIENGGAFYSNYIEGTWSASDIQIAGNTLVYGLSNSAVSTNGYYTNCILTVSEGTGKGQYREITGYRVLSLNKEITINSAFTTIPDSTSQYTISPKVLVTGDGSETSNVVARALINAASSNAVYKVEILNRGAGFRKATATVCVNPYVAVTNTANLTVIIPPKGGHGANVFSELGATSIGVSVKFSNTESNTIPSDNDYRQIGILNDPAWSNVTVNILNTDGTSGSNGTFLMSEKVLKIEPLYLFGNVSTNTTSAVITGTGTVFQRAFSSNSWIMLQAGTSYFITRVSAVTNSTSLSLVSNGVFTNASCNVALVNVKGYGYVNSVSSGVVRLTNVHCQNLSSNDFLIGVNSFAVGLVNNYTIQGLSKSFVTFDQRQKFTGTLTSGTFLEDEPVFMEVSGSNVATGNFHSTDAIGGNTKIYVTNVSGSFSVTGNIIGNTSGAIFAVTGKYLGDLVVDSGDILYLENITPVSRGNNQSEIVKIVIEV